MLNIKPYKRYWRIFNSGYLRIIGIALFIWIVMGIDHQQLILTIKQAHIPFLILALFLQLLVYTAKTLRWHTMVRSTGIQPTFLDSWRLYNIGVFLATITPAKLGEFGKAAYLKKEGLSPVIGIVLVIADRLADVIVISLLSIVGVGILFGMTWSLIAILLVVLLCLITLLIWSRMSGEYKLLIKMTIFTLMPEKKTISMALFYTVLSWIFYFGWAIYIAYSIDITVNIPVLISVFTITGILSLLPIAPAGLGTRDAALLTLLASYGVISSQAVALALLMFCSILIMGIPGGLCWIMQGSRQKG